MKKLILGSLVLSSVLFAESSILDPKTFSSLNTQEQVKEVPKDLKTNKFYLGIKPKEIKKLQKKDKVLKETLDKFDGAILNYKAIIKPIVTNDEITVHPYFTTTLLLPSGANISYVDTSADLITLKFEQNTILVRVKREFEISNLTILYKLGDKNYVMNVMLKRYYRQKTDEKLSLVYHYKNIKKIPDLEVIEAYIKTYKKYPTKKINYIYLNGITYRIIRNDNGKLFIKGKKYLIDMGETR